MALVRSVNVGLPKVIGERKGVPIVSGIDKRSVDGPLAVRGVNVDGDGQADLTVHGGVDKAVYAYAHEDGAWWADELDREIWPGIFGENLTTEGLDVTGAVVGEHWRVGEVEFEVAQPRLPCFKLGMQFDDPRMLKRFVQASRPGAYLRIVKEGTIAPGDTIEVISRPDHGVTVALVADAIQKDIALGPQALQAPELAESLAGWLRDRV